ncbi:hypothetical protein STENM36S_04393 [Streptomyces tendae]
MAQQKSARTLPRPLHAAVSAVRKVPGAGTVGRAAEGTLDRIGAVSPRGRRVLVYTGAGVLGVAGLVEGRWRPRSRDSLPAAPALAEPERDRGQGRRRGDPGTADTKSARTQARKTTARAGTAKTAAKKTGTTATGTAETGGTKAAAAKTTAGRTAKTAAAKRTTEPAGRQPARDGGRFGAEGEQRARDGGEFAARGGEPRIVDAARLHPGHVIELKAERRGARQRPAPVGGRLGSGRVRADR